MANLINSIKKILLEKSIFKLEYQMSLKEDYLEIYKERLIKNREKGSLKIQNSFNQQLLEAEIKTLSNQDYIDYRTHDQENKLKKRADLKKRVVRAKLSRQLEGKDEQTQNTLKSGAQEKIQNIQKSLDEKIEQLRKTYASRNYEAHEIKLNKLDYEQLKFDVKKNIESYNENFKESNLLKLDKLTHKTEIEVQKIKSILEIKHQKIKALTQQEKERFDMEPDTILSIRNLTMQFGGLKAVDNLSVDVKKGEIFGLIGPNGAGKTTVFNCITQFYKANEGNIWYRNRLNDIVSLNDFKVHNVIKQGIVRTFQNVELIWELSILDNMLVGAHSLYRSNFFSHSFQTLAYKREEAILKKRAEKILADLGLSTYMYFYPVGLPYGVLKKIELARTLMTNPNLIILDEPAAGLNEAETAALAETIKTIQKEYNTTIFLVEHDMGLVMSLCDTICAINFGKMLTVGKPVEIQNNKAVQEAYLGGE